MKDHAFATAVALAFGTSAAFAGGFAAPPAPPIGTNTVATADLPRRKAIPMTVVHG